MNARRIESCMILLLCVLSGYAQSKKELKAALAEQQKQIEQLSNQQNNQQSAQQQVAYQQQPVYQQQQPAYQQQPVYQQQQPAYQQQPVYQQQQPAYQQQPVYQQQQPAYQQQPMYQQQPVYQQPQGYYPQPGYQPQGDGYVTVAMTRLEQKQFEDPSTLRTIGTAEYRDQASAKDMAEQVARAQMQRNIESFTKDALERYRKQTSVGDAETYMANDEILSRSAAKGATNGCRIVDQEHYYNPQTKKHKYEVLVEYDKASVMTLVESQDAQVRKNKALFEKEMQAIFDEYEFEKTGSTHQQKVDAVNAEAEQKKLDAQHQRDMETRQQIFDNNQRSVEQQQQYNLQYQQNQNNYNLQQNQQNKQYNQQRQYNYQNNQYRQNYNTGTRK